MLNNFPDSLPRKRIFFRIPSRNVFEDSIPKEKLAGLVWEMPLKKISERYNTYPKMVRETCTKWGIKRPEPHYWHKILKGNSIFIQETCPGPTIPPCLSVGFFLAFVCRALCCFGIWCRKGI